jgi:hypothetical protein
MSQGDVQQTSRSLAGMHLAANANANVNRQAPAGDVPMHGAQADMPLGLEEDVGENAAALPGELLSVPRSFAV